MTAGTAGTRLVVLFDRDCGLCQASARALRRWDRAGRLDVVPLQDAADSPHAEVAAVAKANLLAAELHVLDEATGGVERGGDAALTIAAALPGGAVIRVLKAIPPVRWLVGIVYGLIARNRHAIGRRLGLEGPACDVRP